MSKMRRFVEVFVVVFFSLDAIFAFTIEENVDSGDDRRRNRGECERVSVNDG